MEVYDEILEASTASLEERIFLPDIIVRAALVSAPKGRLRFRAVEYLKGTEQVRSRSVLTQPAGTLSGVTMRRFCSCLEQRTPRPGPQTAGVLIPRP